MAKLILSAPTDFFRNSTTSYDTSAPPDRFTAIPGLGNYRGAKIKTLEQMILLKKQYGIKTIVNLARDSMYDQECGGGECEPQWAAELGLNYVYVPLGSSPPDQAGWNTIRQALIQGHAYVHCTYGVDRTGAVAGRWVREVLGMSDDQLLDYTYGFGGQWRSAGDPNHKLRTWMVGATHDPSLVASLNRGFPWVVVGAIGGTAVLAALIYRIRFK